MNKKFTVLKLMKTVSTLIILFTSNIALGQVKDFGLWSGVGIEAKILPKTTFSIDQNFRFKENITATKSFFTDFGIAYKFHKRFKTNFIYRIGQKPNFINPTAIEQRINLDLTYNYKINNLKIYYRIRIQNKYQNYNRSETGAIPNGHIRNRLKLTYNLDKVIKPFAAIELFTQFNNYKGNLSDEIRYYAGAYFSINKTQDIKAYILHDREFNVNKPLYANIIGISYVYSIKLQDKSKGEIKETRDL